jgi:hypothetical protein
MRHLRFALLVLATAAFAACTSMTAPTAHDCSGYGNPNGMC